MALSCVYESYWDMLPPEIQEYILEFKFSQEQIDEAREELMSMLRQEIRLYRSVKVHWEWGHVQCVVPRVACGTCGQIHMPRVYGHYKDIAHVKKRQFLGHGLSQALVNVDDAKRSCAPYLTFPGSFQDPRPCTPRPNCNF